MNIGQTVKGYHYRRDLDDRKYVCSLGCKHIVTYHEVKRLTIIAKRHELVPHLGYDRDAFGDVFEAVDTQGRDYIYVPTWEGPGVWTGTVDDKKFWTRPVIRMDAAFDILGNKIS